MSELTQSIVNEIASARAKIEANCDSEIAIQQEKARREIIIPKFEEIESRKSLMLQAAKEQYENTVNSISANAESEKQKINSDVMARVEFAVKSVYSAHIAKRDKIIAECDVNNENN